MLAFENVLKSDFSAYVVRTGYNTAGGSTQLTNVDKAAAIIRELLRGNIAGIRQSAGDASTSISIIQTFTGAADSIGNKLAAMKELAEKAPSPDYSQVQVEEIQKEFKALGKEINQIVENTEYSHNKLFTSEGKSISLSIGNDSKVDIFARDFSFDAEGLDLTADAAGALAKVKKEIANLNEYSRYLGRQAERLQVAMATIESDYEKVMGIEVSDFDMSCAKEVASDMVSKALDNKSALLKAQANVMPATAGRLLEYKPAYTKQNT